MQVNVDEARPLVILELMNLIQIFTAKVSGLHYQMYVSSAKKFAE